MCIQREKIFLAGEVDTYKGCLEKEKHVTGAYTAEIMYEYLCREITYE